MRKFLELPNGIPPYDSFGLQNMAVLRHLALNLLKNDDAKGSLRQKRIRASLDEDFLFQLVTQI